jgi:hypothetical protein
MNEQELYKLYRTIREEIRNLGENIRPGASSTSPAGIFDSGYEQALDEAVDILDKHFAPLHDKFADQAA